MKHPDGSFVVVANQSVGLQDWRNIGIDQDPTDYVSQTSVSMRLLIFPLHGSQTSHFANLPPDANVDKKMSVRHSMVYIH